MFEFRVSKDMKEEKKKQRERRIPIYLLSLCLTLIVKELKISVEQGRVHGNNSKYTQTLNILLV